MKTREIRKKRRKGFTGDTALEIFVTLILLVVLVVVGYPVIYVVSASFSNNEALTAGSVILWPVNFTVSSYNFVFHFEQVWVGYRNTVFYTVVGVIFTLIMETIMAYPLSKKKYQGRKVMTTLMIIAMLTTAGLIPSYIIKKMLGLVDTVWAVLLTGILGFRNVIILRTAFQSSVPEEMYEAAKIDGAGDFQTLALIGLPLVKPTVSVLTLYAAVAKWNEYFTSMIYLHDQKMYPLQLVLRSILTASQTIDASAVSGSEMMAILQDGTEGIRYALIVISTVPLLVIYAIVQKSFKGGVMIGAVKG